MIRKTFFVAAAACLLVSGMAVAEQFGTNPNVKAPFGGTEGGGCGDTSFTQSVDAATITAMNSVSCNSMATGFHTDNSYSRAFDLAGDFGISEDFEVCGVQIGVEDATAGAGGVQPADFNLFSAAPGVFPTAFTNLTSIGTSAVSVPDQAAALYFESVTGTVPAGEELIVEFFTPDGDTDGNTFFIGSNSLGENDPSYLAAADCGITDPTSTGDIGFPEMQIVMTVFGTAAGPSVPPTDIPTVGTLGASILVVLLGLGGFVLLRRRS
ncbi:MAG: hypothetical protein AAGD06_17300 [Acidobacteriota bacterium]